jgi:hypothetical protein
MDAYFSENEGIFPLKMELVFPGDGGFLPQKMDAYFLETEAFSPRRSRPVFSLNWGPFPLVRWSCFS